MGEHGLLYIPVHAKSRRKKRKRARKKRNRSQFAARQQVPSSAPSPFRVMRGGGSDGNALLSGLQQLLSQHAKDTKKPKVHAEDNTRLLNDLKKLVHHPPDNLMEALQKIVTKHSQTATSSRSEASRWRCPKPKPQDHDARLVPQAKNRWNTGSWIEVRWKLRRADWEDGGQTFTFIDDMGMGQN